ncbi:MAG TPA: hypothetical protein O0X25_02390 [Methanocorpusculum sp.]|nr:hypothetical protein [Methanocorpusculum sp.]HJJ39965.1 hypothetical protein [Methanocorpusculum sp.]HJJ49449.1 hypothetical protein [Methanocorpusculum sp.]HJJ57000.1 hypothetical protein [Methanocorpusculum sp.]
MVIHKSALKTRVRSPGKPPVLAKCCYCRHLQYVARDEYDYYEECDEGFNRTYRRNVQPEINPCPKFSPWEDSKGGRK